MQLLPLLVTVLACLAICAQAQEETTTARWRSRLDRFREGVKQRFGKLSEEKKARLFRGRNCDPEKRKARLERLLSRRNHTMTSEQIERIQARLAKLVPIQTEKPNEQEPVDLFEVNAKEGVDEYLWHGDMNLSEDQLKHIEDEKDDDDDELKRVKRQASSVFKKWAGNTVYFYFDTSLSDRKKASVIAAHQYLQSRTCINFIQSSTATNRVKVYNGSGCFSDVGMVGGEQELSLGEGCEVIGTAAHEFTHALGIFHTQMRSDRDTYVTIDMTYVPTAKQGNFDKLATADNLLLTPYEYGSMMHYSSNSFTNPSSQLSIVPKDMRYAYTMGNRQISFYDVLMINKHYGCDAACPAATSAKCKNGGMPNPRNCATCNCPLGYEGTLCDQRPAGCGETLAATSAWQSKQYSYGDTTDNVNVRDTFTYCNHWIQAPEGQCPQVQITSMWNSQCQYGCPFNGIEIKGDADQKMTNPRYCCPEFNNQIFNSTLNPTPVISFNRFYYTTFTIQYRAVPCSDLTTTTVTTTTTKKTTTTTSTTTSSLAKRSCISQNTPEICANLVASGFCNDTSKSWLMRKWNCGVECGFCGQAGPTCVDMNPSCAVIKANGMCQSWTPMKAENQCQKTCGFCDVPN